MNKTNLVQDNDSKFSVDELEQRIETTAMNSEIEPELPEIGDEIILSPIWWLI